MFRLSPTYQRDKLFNLNASIGKGLSRAGLLSKDGIPIIHGLSGVAQDGTPLEKAILIDKGYFRPSRYWRVGIFGLHSWRLLNLDYTRDRLGALSLRLEKPVEDTEDLPILLGGTSQKFCTMFGLGNCTGAHERLLTHVRRFYPDRRVVYRPKPSWQGAVPLPGTEWGLPHETDLAVRGSSGVVTYSSNLAVDAWRLGRPAAVMQQGVLRNFSCALPFQPVDATVREKVFRALAYMQWTTEELSRPRTWHIIKEQLDVVSSLRRL